MQGSRNDPEYSVIVPTRNRSSTLERAVRSVLAQTVTDLEVLVVDDGSTDDTAERLAEIGDRRVRYVRQEARGVSVARNRGAGAARGRFLVFLDSDDEVLPGWLEIYSRGFEEPRVGVVCAGCRVEPEGGRPEAVRVRLPTDLGPAFERQEGLFLAGTFAVRREVFSAIGGYTESLAYSENHDLGLRLVRECRQQGLRISAVPEVGLVYHRDGAPALDAEACRKRLRACLHYLRRHRGPLDRDPRLEANLMAVAGVEAARLGRRRIARGLLWRAFKRRPADLRNTGRLVLALVPHLGRRFWLGRHRHRALTKRA